MDRERRSGCEHEVRHWSGHSNKSHVSSGVAECAKIDRHGLGVSEQKWGSQKQQQCRQQDRAEEVDVLQRIERHPPQSIRRVVAQSMGNKCMCGLVQRYGEEDRKHPRRRRVQHHIELHGAPRSDRTLTTLNSSPGFWQ